MQKMKIGQTIKLKGSKIEWLIQKISEDKEYQLVNKNKQNDCRNYKFFAEEDLLERLV